MPGQKAPEDERRAAILKAAFRVAASERLTGFTVEQVAREAGISKGLVFFYFESKNGLLVALLDWLLGRTVVVGAGEVPVGATPQDRLLSVLRHSIERLPAERVSVELFFDYWVMGTRHAEIRGKIRAALDGYRGALRPLARAVVDAEPERYRSVSPDGLAAVAASFIQGCALQAVMDPERFDVAEYVHTVRALIREPGQGGR